MKMDLEAYTKRRNIKVLSGRSDGETLRKEFGLDRSDSSNDLVVVSLGKELYSMNASFFLGLFGPSVRNLGECRFREKFQFECDDIIRKNIEDGISRALKSSNALERPGL